MSKRKLNDYIKILGREEIKEIKKFGDYLSGCSIQHINSTRVGGGVAEILENLIPLMREVGLSAKWSVLEGTQEFYNVTKAFHNALHGQDIEITPEMFDIYIENNKRNYKLIDNDEDFIVLHDPQPLSLIEKRKKNKTKWVWRCHIDLSEADIRLWGMLRMYVEKADGAVFHLPEYAKGLYIDQYIIPPAIDPLSDKNRELPDEVINETIEKFNIDKNRPIILQVSRFDRLKDPVGVIEVFKIVKRWHNCQLVLAGGAASDDPEGEKVLNEVRERSEGDPDIHILNLPPDSHIEINALQRAATIVLQKSVREGFGLVVTEAMWKGKPVIGGAVGGIQRQIIHGETGFLTQTIEGTAFRVRQLLGNPGLANRLGRQGKEYVRSNFLLPTYLKNWILLLLSLKHPERGIINLG
ncbi:glycosyl transferase family 1 [candidate division KSB1 bacterium]|nr:MAG: glycosyl transferase family 1 [candidate division KSB1 bacterium]